MARYKERTIRIGNIAQEVVAVRVYHKPDDGEPLTYNDPYTEMALPGAGDTCDIMIPGDVPALQGADGTWRIGSTVLDEFGNEDDIVEYVGPFDFCPPPQHTMEVI